MKPIKPKLITVKPITNSKTGIGQAFEQFIKDTNLKYTKLKTK